MLLLLYLHNSQFTSSNCIICAENLITFFSIGKHDLKSLNVIFKVRNNLTNILILRQWNFTHNVKMTFLHNIRTRYNISYIFDFISLGLDFVHVSKQIWEKNLVNSYIPNTSIRFDVVWFPLGARSLVIMSSPSKCSPGVCFGTTIVNSPKNVHH